MQQRVDVNGRWEQLVSAELEATRSNSPEEKFPREMQGLSACRHGSVLFLLRGRLLVDRLLGLLLFRVTLGFVRSVEDVH